MKTQLYSATNPQAIIDQFERRAKATEDRAKHEPKLVARLCRAEGITWRAAADILRNTEFVGWNAPTDFTAAADYVAEAKTQGVHYDDEPTRKGEEMDKHGMFDYSDKDED